MQFRTITVAELKSDVARLAFRNKYIRGTALASPTPTGTDFSLNEAKRFPDGHFQAQVFSIVSGTGEGQASYCDDSARGTGTITVSPAFDPVPDSTSVLESWPEEITPDDVLAAINTAVETALSKINVYTELSGPDLDESYQFITIPDTWVKFCEVKYLDAGSVWRVYRYSHTPDLPGQEQGRDFTINGRSLRLSEPIPSDIDPDNIFISGYRLPNRVSGNSDTVECPIAFATYHVAGVLQQALIGLADTDPEGHQQRSSGWFALAQRELAQIPYTNYRPNTILLET